MVLLQRNIDVDETMPQIVPSAGYTPPCDYSNFAEHFDLSLLPGGESPLSPSTLLYGQSPEKDFKIYSTFYNVAQEREEADFRPDFQKLLETDPQSPVSNIYLEVPPPTNFHPNSPNSGSLSPYSPQSLVSPNDQLNTYRQSTEANFYPSSPEQSLYAPSPSSIYSKSPRDDFYQNAVKSENPSPIPSFGTFVIKEESFLSNCDYSSPPNHTEREPEVLLDKKQIKQEESTVDFSSLLDDFQNDAALKGFLEATFDSRYKTELNEENSEDSPKDHRLLREALRDTSFQKKYNVKEIDFGSVDAYVKMEEDELGAQLTSQNIEPVLSIAIEEMRKEVDKTCATLGISADPSQWTVENVFSWIQWTCREFNLPEPSADRWNITGSNLLELNEEDFSIRSNQGGMILHAQLEIWKAAHCSDDLAMNWLPEPASSNASSGDISDDEDDESSVQADPGKPSTSRTGSHIHLWQFLKELLQNPQTHGTCIKWLDRSKGIFKIEDSVKVARLWGRRKNRPAMNYDKLSRSIRQYYKKGIMKKTERSQRLVYQFCHPYNS